MRLVSWETRRSDKSSNVQCRWRLVNFHTWQCLRIWREQLLGNGAHTVHNRVFSKQYKIVNLPTRKRNVNKGVAHFLPYSKFPFLATVIHSFGVARSGQKFPACQEGNAWDTFYSDLHVWPDRIELSGWSTGRRKSVGNGVIRDSMLGRLTPDKS